MKEQTKPRILLVDDEPDIIQLLSQILSSEGYDILTAPDGDRAVEILDRERVDATLLDILMPNRNGMSVLRHIRDHHPTIKTIMLTGYIDLQYAMEAKKMGAVDYISKPYKLETILSTLERALK